MLLESLVELYIIVGVIIVVDKVVVKKVVECYFFVVEDGLWYSKCCDE